MAYDVSQLRDGDTSELSALVDGTSFRIPPGYLKAGVEYYATIAARQAPWDGPDRPPLRVGAPLYTAACVTGHFYP
jgi:hypothetical protein